MRASLKTASGKARKNLKPQHTIVCENLAKRSHEHKIIKIKIVRNFKFLQQRSIK
jgi:hypothetical protein